MQRVIGNKLCGHRVIAVVWSQDSDGTKPQGSRKVTSAASSSGLRMFGRLSIAAQMSRLPWLSGSYVLRKHTDSGGQKRWVMLDPQQATRV